MTFKAVWRLPGGVKISKTFDQRSDAEAWLEGNRAAIRRAVQAGGVSGTTPLGPYWIQNVDGILHDLRMHTRRGYEASWKCHVQPRWGTVPMGAITHDEIAAWLRNELPKKGISNSTSRLALSVLAKALHFAVADRIIPSNPAMNQRRPKAAVKKHKLLDHEDVLALADHVAPRFQAMVLLMGFGGLRISEAAGLRPENVSDDGRRVTIEHQLLRDTSMVTETKTEAGRRTVPMVPDVARALTIHKGGFSSPEWFFCTEDGNPIQYHNFRRHYFDDVVRSILPERKWITPHDLRHTAVALWFQNGVNPKKIAAWGGWSDPTMPLKIYGYVMYEDEDAGLDALNERIMASRLRTR